MNFSLLLLPLIFVVIWCAVLRFLAWSTGWTRLAKRYPESDASQGVKVRATWIAVGWAEYNGCVTYVVDAEGLHIALWPVFNFGHAPLFIPWTEMRVEEVRKVFGRRGQIVKLAIGEPLVCRLRLPERVFEAGKQVLPPAPVDEST